MAKPKDRRKIAEELVTIHRDNRDLFERMDGLKSQLKALAGDAGESFREEFAGIGKVSVSPPKDKRFTGTMPECVPEAFLALRKPEQDKLLDRGLIRMAEQYVGRSYGSVTVDLF